jgi:hypothetical protein
MTKIAGWIFAAVGVGAVIFKFPRVGALLGQRFRRHRIIQGKTVPAVSISRLAQDCPTPVTTTRRGYDTPEIFRKDTLVRIKILQLRIEENAKRISKMTRRMRQYKKVYEDRIKRLDDEDENE